MTNSLSPNSAPASLSLSKSSGPPHQKLHLGGPRGRLHSTWKILRDPYATYRQWKKQYGETFLVKALNGDVVVTCNTENIRNIFAAPSDSIGQFAVGTITPLLGGSSVILVEGEQHRQQRKLLTPSFRGELIADKSPIINEVARRISRDWQAGQTVCIMDHALDISLEVIIRIVFGMTALDRVVACKEKLVRFVRTFRPSLAFSKLLQRPLFGLSPWNRFVRARNDCMDLLQQEIEQRRESGLRGPDLLSRLLDDRFEDGTEMSDAEIRDQLATMLFAGHETTQIAIAWAMSWLVRNPQYLQRLRNELDEDDLDTVVQSSELLSGICNESLRLNPIVPDLIRVLKNPVQFVDQEIPAGTNVGILLSLVHYDPELYSDPERFDPDRWATRTYKGYEFLPFGGGVRRCLGATLATLEMKIVVAAWIKDFDFSLPDHAPVIEPVHRRNLTMAPKSGIPLLIKGVL
jgi:cytochrome P450